MSKLIGKRFVLLSVVASIPLVAWMLVGSEQAPVERPARKLVLLVHGGAGDRPEEVPPELEKKRKAVLEEALRRGYAHLKNGKSTASLNAVETAIRVLEDSPLFNAGKGAVFTHEGRHELDASIMAGKDKKAGAVAGVSIIKNPITAARAVLEHSPHVLLIGRGAELFAIKQKIEIVHPDYFWTPQRWQELQDTLKKKGKKHGRAEPRQRPERHRGTVGAVALDGNGNLAAGTSTGGMTNKWSGRVGDSPNHRRRHLRR